jgi:hypothetical protein
VPQALLAALDLCLAGQLVGAGESAVAALWAELQKLLQVSTHCAPGSMLMRVSCRQRLACD